MKIKDFLKNSFLIKIYKRIKFFGFKYYCPFCFGFSRTFFSAGFNYPIFKKIKIIGAGLRDNVRCPYCNSSNRERLFLLYIKKKVMKNIDRKNFKLLHVAPEKNLQIFLKNIFKGNHVSIDLNSKLADKAMDVTELDFKDNFFDLIICSHVLEHIQDEKLALKEIFRVLKIGGSAILQSPYSPQLDKTFEDFKRHTPQENIELFGQDDHVRIYGNDFVERLGSVGFDVDLIDPCKEFSENRIRKYSLNPEEKLVLCKK